MLSFQREYTAVPNFFESKALAPERHTYPALKKHVWVKKTEKILRRSGESLFELKEPGSFSL